jgi:hypothetical protein
MEQHEESNPIHYPLGRGYGHDYMRGGEVFGGYGYREREDYARTRGGTTFDDNEIELDETQSVSQPRDDYPSRDTFLNARSLDDTHPDSNLADRQDAPVPQLEHSFGDIGNGWRHSRSYYVTQAQLQARQFPKPD